MCIYGVREQFNTSIRPMVQYQRRSAFNIMPYEHFCNECQRILAQSIERIILRAEYSSNGNALHSALRTLIPTLTPCCFSPVVEIGKVGKGANYGA
jgi:hypothetical protein